MGIQSEDSLPKLRSRERWYTEHFTIGISVENLFKDGLFTRYDLYLLDWWRIYYYYDHDYNVLPRAKDGGLNYGLIQCMKAIDTFFREGKEAREAEGKPQDSGDKAEESEDII